MADRIAPNPHSPYADAAPDARHLLHGLFGEPQPGQLVLTGCNRLAVVPEEPLRTVGSEGATFPSGTCGACISAWYAMNRGQELPDERPLTECECGSETRHDGLCALCRQEKHEEWWRNRGDAPAADAAGVPPC